MSVVFNFIILHRSCIVDEVVLEEKLIFITSINGCKTYVALNITSITRFPSTDDCPGVYVDVNIRKLNQTFFYMPNIWKCITYITDVESTNTMIIFRKIYSETRITCRKPCLENSLIVCKMIFIMSNIIIERNKNINLLFFLIRFLKYYRFVIRRNVYFSL